MALLLEFADLFYLIILAVSGLVTLGWWLR